MKSHLFPALKLTGILLLICSGIYPLMIAGIGMFAPGQGNGVTIQENGRVVGYENIGQNFVDDKYFSGRPSANNYNSAVSGGSNKGPADPDYLVIVATRIDTFLAHNPGITKAEIPSDLITASGSGLDPDISIAAAKIQVKRIAKLRNLSEAQINQLIQENIRKPLLGCLGPASVSVLKLNLALNKMATPQN